MTDRQEKFVAQYLIDLNATQAAIRAGYAAKTANREGARLLSNVDIQTAIEKRRKRIMEKVELTQEDVVRGLKGEAELYGEGSSHSARVSAWTALGKYLGMFTDKVEHSGPGGGPMRFEQMTDDELVADIRRIEREIEGIAGQAAGPTPSTNGKAPPLSAVG